VARLRVVQVTHDLGIGGLPRVVTTLCKSLDKDRFAVSVLCLNDEGPLAGELEESSVPVSILPGSPDKPDYLAFLKVARFLRQARVELVHTHNTQPFLDAGLATLLARTPTLVHTDHGRDFPDKRRYMIAERVLSRFAYRVVGVSDDTSRKLVRYEKIDPRKIATIHNGIEDESVGAAANDGAKKAEIGIPREAPVVGVGARLIELKGLEYLLQAMPTVLQRIPDAKLVIAGYGPLEGRLRGLARDLGVGSATHILGPRRDMAQLLRAFDVYALPSVSEGLPLILLEAMAAGCPIVATRVGGVPEAVRDGKNGLLVAPRRADELADALIQVLTDQQKRQRFSRESRRIFESGFTARIMARRYEALYLRQSPPAPRLED
jgi:glycosyltransferase involved in cell wall biosynthesis